MLKRLTNHCETYFTNAFGYDFRKCLREVKRSSNVRKDNKNLRMLEKIISLPKSDKMTNLNVSFT